MTSEKLDIHAIFNEAISLVSDKERSSYLDEACGNDNEARRRVETLLRAHSEAGGFFGGQSPPPGATVAYPVTEKPNTQIGPYKLLQQIGEGGMGVVYMAEQTRPIERRVAVKVIKPGMDTRQVLARFEAEEQALAMMDHPNIAKVFDAGSTDTGRPYFVMELVKGQPITQYCDEHHLTPRERLELFLPVCQAVQHAHQKGIIHRDIKPSNVMVAHYDDRPVPKIIDFGVAKAIEQRLTEKTVFTEFGQVVGTIEYMSPEQARLNQLDIDTRTDVYSLGVLLYELLTGETPFDGKRLRSAAFDELLRIIREEEPPRPSLRLSSSESLPSIAANRHLEPKQLSALVHGELDWIVMKALEKDRARRYDTASKFAEDVQHYLNDEAVAACPPSAAYRFRKFVRRNKIALLTSAALAAALVLGTAASVWQAIRATRAEASATAARNEAEANFHKALAAVDEMLTQVGHESLANIPQMEPVRRALLEKALTFYQDFLQERSTEPRIRLESARAYQRVSDIYYMLGQHLQAEQACRQAIAIFAELEAEFPELPTYREEAAESYRRLGPLIESMEGQLEEFAKESEHALRQALTRLEKLAAEFPDEPRYGYALANTYGELARILWVDGQCEEAETGCRKAIALHGRLSNRFPATPDEHAALANHYSQLGEVLQQVGRHDEAERYFRGAVELKRKTAALAPAVTKYQCSLALGLHRFGKFLDSHGRPQEAEQVFLEALTLQEGFVQDFPNVWDYRWELTFTLADFGEMLGRGGRSDEAQTQFARAVEIYRPTLEYREKAVREFPAETGPYRWAYGSYGFLANLLRLAGRAEDAIAVRRKKTSFKESNAAKFTEDQFNPFKLAFDHAFLADLLKVTSRHEEAAKEYLRAAELLKQPVTKLPEHPDGFINYLIWLLELRAGGDSYDWFFVAMAHWQLGNNVEAQKWFDRAIFWMETNNPDDKDLIRLRVEAAALLGVNEEKSSTLNEASQETTPEADNPKPVSPLKPIP